MALTKVSSDMISPDPTNASNLSSGDVPLAQLGNVPASDTSDIEDDIALLGFKVAANGAFGKYNLVDQTEDAFMDTTGVDASLSTNEIRNEANYYAGGGPTVTVTPFSYTGSDQAYSVPSTVASLNFIAWGAGGGGGNASSGGGGGFIEGTVNVTPLESLTVKVGGGGGINHVPASQPGGGGGGTGIYRGATVLAIAGAGGGGENAVNAGPGGGTTGGAGLGPGAGLVANGGTQVAGGAAVDGGGAGSLNQGGDVPSGPSTATGGYNGGGDGDGDNVNYTSGGGGGGYYGGSSGGASGSNHGSGAGGSSLTAGTNTQAVGATVANAGHANYAAGTGNGGVNAAGQNGNAVIQYNAVSDLTLVSTATEAETTPTKGDIVMTYTNGVAGAGGVTAINTDLKAYASRDDGSNWTQLTLAAQGSTGSHFIVSSHNVDISSQPSDKTMRYKIETLNQSGSKETRIQAVSLGWS